MSKQGLLILFVASTIFALQPNDGCTVENCLLCPEKVDTCTMCKPEYYLVNNTCGDCPINCKYCTGGESADCTQCIEQHAFNSEHLCINVGIDNCLNADESSKCKECIPEFYLANNTCFDCAINCNKCSGSEFADCEVCNQLYALDKDNYCRKIDVENCLKTDSKGTKCGQCYQFFALNKKNLCKKIDVENCLKTDETETKCGQCLQLYALDMEESCKKIDVENCWKTDETGTKCGECLKGYKLKENVCKAASGFIKLGILILFFSLSLLF